MASDYCTKPTILKFKQQVKSLGPWLRLCKLARLMQDLRTHTLLTTSVAKVLPACQLDRDRHGCTTGEPASGASPVKNSLEDVQQIARNLLKTLRRFTYRLDWDPTRQLLTSSFGQASRRHSLPMDSVESCRTWAMPRCHYCSPMSGWVPISSFGGSPGRLDALASPGIAQWREGCEGVANNNAVARALI